MSILESEKMHAMHLMQIAGEYFVSLLNNWHVATTYFRFISLHLECQLFIIELWSYLRRLQPWPDSSAPSTICTTSNVPYSVPLMFRKCMGCIGYFGSFANLLNCDSVSKRNSEHSPLHCLWLTLSLLMTHTVGGHVTLDTFALRQVN